MQRCNEDTMTRRRRFPLLLVCVSLYFTDTHGWPAVISGAPKRWTSWDWMTSPVLTRTRRWLVELRRWLSSTARTHSLWVRRSTLPLTWACPRLSRPSFPVTVRLSWSPAKDQALALFNLHQAPHPLPVLRAAFSRTFLKAPKEQPDLFLPALRLWLRLRATSVSPRTMVMLK